MESFATLEIYSKQITSAFKNLEAIIKQGSQSPLEKEELVEQFTGELKEIQTTVIGDQIEEFYFELQSSRTGGSSQALNSRCSQASWKRLRPKGFGNQRNFELRGEVQALLYEAQEPRVRN